jgi:hypothetical protein
LALAEEGLTKGINDADQTKTDAKRDQSECDNSQARLLAKNHGCDSSYHHEERASSCDQAIANVSQDQRGQYRDSGPTQ